MSLRIGYGDIETAPNLGWFYKSKRPQYMHYHQVIQPEFITSFQWMMEGEKKPSAVDLTYNMRAFRDDPTDCKRIVVKMAEFIDNLDILVLHNGKRFDWPEFKKRMILYRLPPVRKPFIVDTLSEAKTAANHSNSLRNLAHYYKLSEKAVNEADPAKLIYGSITSRAEHIKKQTKYGIKDIPPLRDFYLLIRPYMERHPHMGIENEEISCPHCGKSDYQNRGDSYLKGLNAFQRWYYCRPCKRKFSGAVTKRAAR